MSYYIGRKWDLNVAENRFDRFGRVNERQWIWTHRSNGSIFSSSNFSLSLFSSFFSFFFLSETKKHSNHLNFSLFTVKHLYVFTVPLHINWCFEWFSDGYLNSTKYAYTSFVWTATKLYTSNWRYRNCGQRTNSV